MEHLLTSTRSVQDLEPRRDPFARLGDVEIELIISFLDDADTETLRRVSHTWKKYSELFNRYSSLRKRFPWANPREYMAGGHQFANLQFRRHLYQDQCLRRGYATRVWQFEGAMFWHMDDTGIVWVDSTWTLKFCNLRNDHFGPVECQSTTEIPLCSLGFSSMFESRGQMVQIRAVYLVQRRDAMLVLKMTLGEPWPVMRISRQGDVQWAFHDSTKLARSNFAVGKTQLFLLDSSIPDPQGRPQVRLVKRDLATGGILAERRVYPWDASMGLAQEWEILVTEDEQWLTCIKRGCYCTIVLATETGALVRRTGDLSLPKRVVFRSGHPRHSVWEHEHDDPVFEKQFPLDERICFRNSLGHQDGLFSRERVVFDWNPKWGATTMDPERRLAFCVDIPPPYMSYNLKVIQLVETQKSRSTNTSPNSELHQKNQRVSIVTLPPSAGVSADYRSRDSKGRCKIGDMISFRGPPQMIGNYLVNHQPGDDVDENLLVVVDFWPNW